jgi:signal transduction histidine kinase
VNALKFTDKGEIVISTKMENDLLHVHIRDTGIGIAQKDQAKLFGKFAQVAVNNGRPAGTGLGLYISRETLKKMGGDLWLENSTPGVGSDFCFTIPISHTATAQATKGLLIKQGLKLNE